MSFGSIPGISAFTTYSSFVYETSREGSHSPSSSPLFLGLPEKESQSRSISFLILSNSGKGISSLNGLQIVTSRAIISPTFLATWLFMLTLMLRHQSTLQSILPQGLLRSKYARLSISQCKMLYFELNWDQISRWYPSGFH